MGDGISRRVPTYLRLLVHGDLQLLLKLSHGVLGLFLVQLGQLMLLPEEAARRQLSVTSHP